MSTVVVLFLLVGACVGSSVLVSTGLNSTCSSLIAKYLLYLHCYLFITALWVLIILVVVLRLLGILWCELCLPCKSGSGW
jgi:hypothetical protein